MLGFYSRVQTLIPKQDACAAPCHAQTVLSFTYLSVVSFGLCMGRTSRRVYFLVE